jgi:hypothetical protein
MADIKYGLGALSYWEDDGHGWLQVPTVDVTSSGYRPSKYSHRHDTYTPDIPGRVSTLINSDTYLEEDCDIAGFLSALGVALADVPDVVQHIATYRYSMGNCWIRELPHCSGLGFASPFAR